ncbi:hypothetical protein [Fodinicola feengrottensis]|uniref:hypothetical protein n=1 Tax=Fodinicola feengrottensis TaxID=435914 RepID=UPI0013D24D46|nr:hypothetical protein [Fodinicola feengrottensis]
MAHAGLPSLSRSPTVERGNDRPARAAAASNARPQRRTTHQIPEPAQGSNQLRALR